MDIAEQGNGVTGGISTDSTREEPRLVNCSIVENLPFSIPKSRIFHYHEFSCSKIGDGFYGDVFKVIVPERFVYFSCEISIPFFLFCFVGRTSSLELDFRFFLFNQFAGPASTYKPSYGFKDEQTRPRVSRLYNAG